MPITSVSSDPKALTLTIVADYAVSVERLWEAYLDPRQLERFWGPVEYPATFLRHDMCVGGLSHYYMTGPDGTRHGGWWRCLRIEPLRLIELEDGFANGDQSMNDGLPIMRMVFEFEQTATGSRFTGITTFPSVEEMEQMVQMGMMEGLQSAMSQTDAVLADLTSFAASRATEAQLLSDTQVRVSRVIRGTVDQVWRAHHDAALMKRWHLGPDGWTMSVCEIATTVGEHYRFEWENAADGQRFGFEGELLESTPPYRAVTSEQVHGVPGPATRNEMTLTAVPGGTLMALVITYPSKELRDMILATGMTEGMEASYARLEREVLARG